MSRKRNHNISFRLSEDEYEALIKKYYLSNCYSYREFFIKLSNEGEITRLDFDSKELFKHSEELHKIGVNINQIAKIANQTQYISSNQMETLNRLLTNIHEEQERFYNKLDEIILKERIE